jgi:hypothetical protein
MRWIALLAAAVLLSACAESVMDNTQHGTDPPWDSSIPNPHG